jgi:phosphoribosylformimino-5-aminoimidazole carboxamide ribotide isomerase
MAARRRSRRRLRRQAVNAAAVEAILAATKNPVQLGGGIRDMKTVEGWLARGRRPASSSARRRCAIRRFVIEAARRPSRAKSRSASTPDGKVAVEGWAETSSSSRSSSRAVFEGRRRRRPRLHRHRPRRHADRHQLGRHARAGPRRVHSRHRLGRPRLAGRHPPLLAPDAAQARRRDHRPALYDGRIDPAEALALIRG